MHIGAHASEMSDSDTAPVDEDATLVRPASYVAMRLQCSAEAAGVGHISTEHKLWIYNNGDVYWEFRRLLLAFFKERSEVRPCAIIRQETPQWVKWCAELSFEWKDFYKPGMLQYKDFLAKLRRDGDREGLEEARASEDFVREEASVTTLGVLCVLCNWACCRRKVSDRSLALGMMQGIFTVCISQGEWGTLDIISILNEQVGECQDDAVEGVCVCVHVRAVIFEYSSMDKTEPARACAQCLASILSRCGKCMSCRGSLSELLPVLAEMTESNLDEVGNKNIGSWSRMDGPVKRRRDDEDYRRHLTQTMPNRGSSTSAAAAARSHGVSRGTSRRWVEKQVETQVGQCFDLIGGDLRGPVSIAEDGARFGQPAKECQCYAFWASEVEAGAWLPPQDLYGGTLRLLGSISVQLRESGPRRFGHMPATPFPETRVLVC